MAVNRKELGEFIEQLNQDLTGMLDKYIGLDDGMARLDDYYTADELRKIANALDKIARKKTEEVISIGGKPIFKG